MGRALPVLCAAQFMVVLDATIVTVALPTVGAELGFTESGLQYVISLYALSFGALLLSAGRLADRLGRRRTLVAGLAAFTVASLACGLAVSGEMLLVARFAQGAGAALVSAAALALVLTVFPDPRGRARALGAWGAVGGAAGDSGLLVGGALTDTAGWRWVFLINVPAGLWAGLRAGRVLSESRGPRQAPDLAGSALSVAGLGTLIVGLTRATEPGTTAVSTIATLAAAVVLLVAFAVRQTRVSNPLLPPRLLAAPGTGLANAAMLVLAGVVATALFFTTLYVQRTLGLSPLLTGLGFLPNSALVLAGSALAARLVPALGARRVLTAGLALTGLGSALLGMFARPDGDYWGTVLPGFALSGFGLGIAFVAATVGATANVTDDDRGVASGVVNTAQQIGFALGIAVLTTVASAVTAHAGSVISGYRAGHLTGTALAAGTAVVVLAAGHRSGKDLL
ncbi:MFS transporter [Amycolatopsis nigrescens]|uniref:MFS transporter n=1 Tax=Amycolatopsis nigrescens TaxID=381445 RepID=UPI000379B10C|nr:MFS transporter [Amycolatopsis nigrescens]